MGGGGEVGEEDEEGDEGEEEESKGPRAGEEVGEEKSQAGYWSVKVDCG